MIARKNPISTNIGKLSKYLSSSTPPIPKTNIGVMIMYPRLTARLYADQTFSSFWADGPGFDFVIAICQNYLSNDTLLPPLFRFLAILIRDNARSI